MIGREKYWSEIDHPAKTERTRKVVKSLQSRTDRHANDIEFLKRAMESHKHAPSDGSSMVPARQRNDGIGESEGRRTASGNPDDCYF